MPPEALPLVLAAVVDQQPQALLTLGCPGNPPSFDRPHRHPQRLGRGLVVSAGLEEVEQSPEQGTPQPCPHAHPSCPYLWDRRPFGHFPERGRWTTVEISRNERFVPRPLSSGDAMTETIAGITVPDTRLVREATALVRRSADDTLFHHSRRVF